MTGQRFDPRNDQLADLLKAYAEARLSPKSPVLARIRGEVVAQAAKRAIAEQQLEADRARPIAIHPWRRRAIALGLAATVTVGSAAAVFAAPPGSPLYATRLFLETATLPTNPNARSDAHAHLLEQRLGEAQGAAARADGAAVAAAIAAYNAEVQAAIADLGDDPDQLARLELELGRHVAALQALEALVPSQAAGAVNGAIEAGQKAVKRVQDKARTQGGRPTEHPAKP
jgi:hypothetical protein